MTRDKKKGMGGHQSAKMFTDIWLTPPWLLSRLGQFDLDPCFIRDRPWDTAKEHYAREDGDGLSRPWHGRVWLNPPYGLEAAEWIRRLADHGTGTALLFARTETEMFFNGVWDRASGLLFIKGRLYFHYPSGERAKANGGAPSVLIAYGDQDRKVLESLDGTLGKFVQLK